MRCKNIRCDSEFLGRPNQLFCSRKCNFSSYKRNSRIKDIVGTLKLEYDDAIAIVNRGKIKYSINDWIEKCNIKYNSYYDYSKVIFNKLIDKVIIICPRHGEFILAAGVHINKKGCRYCRENKNKHHIIDIRDKLRLNKYFDFVDFDVYEGNTQKVKVICKNDSTHVSNVAIRHLINNNVGCAYCSNVGIPTTEQWIKKCEIIHGYKYDYSDAVYISTSSPIRIVCPNHGEFYQRPSLHANGAGCRKCNKSIGESIVFDILESIKVDFDTQKSFNGLKHKSNLYFDFYLSKYNLCIEFDGIQHYKAFRFFGGEEKLKDTKIKDDIKNKFCIDNGIKLLRISYSINYKTKDKIKSQIYTKIIAYLNEL